jgi:hypothetical protein
MLVNELPNYAATPPAIDAAGVPHKQLIRIHVANRRCDVELRSPVST